MSIYGDNNFIKNVNLNGNNAKIPTIDNYTNIPSRYYIDGVNGNDSNNGTEASPWKTMDKFFELLNKGFSDIRCYIKTAGTYNISKNVISNSILHITGLVDNIILQFQNPAEQEVAFYSCHLNFEKLTIRGNQSNESINIHNSDFAFDKIKFENCFNVDLYGCNFNCTTCQFTRLYCDESNGIIDDTVITRCDLGTAIVARRSSDLSITGTLDFKTQNGIQTSNNLIVAERSVVRNFMQLISSPPASPITTGKTMVITGSTLHSTEVIVNTRMKKYATQDYTYSSAALIVLTNQVIS